MIVVRWLWLVSMLLMPLSALSIPADGSPDPARLKPDWWTFFELAPDDTQTMLEQRIQAASKDLSELKQRFSDEGRQPQVVASIERVLIDLIRFQKLSVEPLPKPNMATHAQESYSLFEIRTLIDELSKTEQEREIEAQELELLDKALSVALSELNRQKVDYRALHTAAPERTLKGLELMHSKLQVELGELEVTWRRASKKALDLQIANLEALADAAPQRMTATAAEIAVAKQAKAMAEKKVAELRSQLLQAQLGRTAPVALSPIEQAVDKLAVQRLVALNVSIIKHEIIALQQALIEKILVRVREGNVANPNVEREYLRGYSNQLNSYTGKLPELSRSTRRSRDSALSRLNDSNDSEIKKTLEARVSSADATSITLREVELQLTAAAQFGDFLDSLLQQRESVVTRGVQTVESLFGTSWDQILHLTKTSLFEIGGTPVTTRDIVRMLIILLLSWWISKVLRGALTRLAERRQTVNTGSVYTLSRMLHYLILLIGTIVALSSIGIDFTKFALFASALGVGIGFGLQTLVSNFVAGLIILFEKSLKIGDFVELESGVTGEVREINMRSTLITTNDNIDIVVPNSEFVNSRVTNWTMREAHRRIHIPFGVAYGTDKELVRKAGLEAAKNVPVTLVDNELRQPKLWFVEFGDSSLNFELVVWLNPDSVKSPGAVNAMYLWEIDNKLREYGIEVPFPQRDLHLRSVANDIHLKDLTGGLSLD